MVRAARARPLWIAASFPLRVAAHRILLDWQPLMDSPGALLRRSGVVSRLPKTSGFQVDGAGIGLTGIGLNCRAAESGTRGCRFHFAEHAREVKGQDPR